MPRNERLLPPNTKLIWEGASAKKERVARIKQHNGVFVFNYEIPINPGATRHRYLTPSRSVALACAFLGLTARQSGTYQDVSENTVKTNLGLVYNQLGIKKSHFGAHPRTPYTLSRLCELGILELERPTTLTNELTPSLATTTKWLIRGQSFAEIAATADETTDLIKAKFYTARDEEGFDTTMGYLLHLVGARAIGNITYKPELAAPPPRPMHTY